MCWSTPTWRRPPGTRRPRRPSPRTTAGVVLWLSRQVLREYLVSLTRPQQFPIPPDLATVIAQVQQFPQRFQVANKEPEVTARLLALLTAVPTRGRRIHDVNIVATMLVYGVRRRLTHNTEDFARFTGLLRILPFLYNPQRPRHPPAPEPASGRRQPYSSISIQGPTAKAKCTDKWISGFSSFGLYGETRR